MRELKIDTCVYLRLQWHPALREGSSRGSILSLCRYPCFILDKSRSSLTRRYTRDALSAFLSPHFFLFFFSRHVISSRVIEAFFARTTLPSWVRTRDENRIRGPRRYICVLSQKVSARNHYTLVRDRLKVVWILAFNSRLSAFISKLDEFRFLNK